jgi:hypothetical protein
MRLEMRGGTIPSVSGGMNWGAANQLAHMRLRAPSTHPQAQTGHPRASPGGPGRGLGGG